MMPPALNNLIQLSRYWSVSDAMWLIWTYGHEADQVCWQSFWTTPKKMWHQIPGDSKAFSIPVKFWGGPYHNKEICANLATFTIDRVLTVWKLRGIGWFWILLYCPMLRKSLREQLKEYVPEELKKNIAGLKYADNYLEPVVTMNDREYDDIEYSEGERIIDYVQVGDKVYPILESGRQGCVVERGGRQLPDRAAKSLTRSDDGTVYRWSSSGQVGVCESI